MPTLNILAGVALLSAVLVSGTTEPAQAAGAGRAGHTHAHSFRHACRSPLKFAAGACVKRCPAGYRDTGRTCRFRNMSR